MIKQPPLIPYIFLSFFLSIFRFFLHALLFFPFFPFVEKSKHLLALRDHRDDTFGYHYHLNHVTCFLTGPFSEFLYDR